MSEHLAILCNSCHVMKKGAPNLKFTFRKCLHVFCEKCATAVCPICQRSTAQYTIDNGMPATFADYFKNALDRLNSFRDVLRFQTEQNTYCNQIVCATIADHQKIQVQHANFYRVRLDLFQKINNEAERIKRLTEVAAIYDPVYGGTIPGNIGNTGQASASDGGPSAVPGTATGPPLNAMRFPEFAAWFQSVLPKTTIAAATAAATTLSQAGTSTASDSIGMKRAHTSTEDVNPKVCRRD